ncbi:MAG: hydroxymethylbilane synthase, partial [Candidatus Binataceae bacterium]
MATRFRIGTRPSRLARVQAELVRKQLEAVLPGLQVELVPITTSGDRNRSPSLAQAGGKGLFVKELEQALRERRIDVCVHSIKDLPAKLGGDFRLAAVPAREDPRDAIVTREAGGLSALREGARIGTSSARRKFQALRLRPDLEIVALRGNVDTRLGKVARGDLDGIIVAAAGLNRLGRPGELTVTELDDRDF